MIRVLTLFAALISGALIAPPAHAQACGDWRAEVWDTEVGPMLTAFVCNPTEDGYGVFLSVQCFGADRVNLRYDAGGSGDGDLMVAFISDGSIVREKMVYEAMDHALAAYPPVDGPLITLLRSGSDLRIEPPEGFLPGEFSLTGSSAAIAEILANCRG